MYREWKKIEFPKEYCIWIWKQQGWEVDQEIGWQDEVREDGILVGGKGWKERVYNREEWKKLLRTARNCHILHRSVEWMNLMLLKLWLLTKNYMLFLNFGVIVTHHKCICVHVPSTLKMATWVANTCLWLLYNKIIFVLPSGLVGLFKIFYSICLNLTVLWNLSNRNTKKLANSCLKLLCDTERLLLHCRLSITNENVMQEIKNF